MFIDTHTHLNLEPLWSKHRALINQAKAIGVERFIVPGADIATSDKAVTLAREYSEVYAAIGIHPESSAFVQNRTAFEAALETIDTLLTESKIVASGEIGLDYYRIPSSESLSQVKAAQVTLFSEQLQLARARKLPVILHTRTEEAMWDAYTLVTKYEIPKVVFHCFSGDQRFLDAILEPGYYVGVGGVITFPNALSLREMISRCDPSRVFLETDAPYLAPQPHRGEVNEPAYVTITGQKLAELWGLSLADVASKTTQTAKAFFGIS